MSRKKVVYIGITIFVLVWVFFNTHTYLVPIDSTNNAGYSCFGLDFDTHLSNSNEVRQRVCIGDLSTID